MLLQLHSHAGSLAPVKVKAHFPVTCVSPGIRLQSLIGYMLCFSETNNAGFCSMHSSSHYTCDFGFGLKWSCVMQVEDRLAALYHAVLKTTLFSSSCCGAELSLTPLPPWTSIHAVLFSTELSLHPGVRKCGQVDLQYHCPTAGAPDRFDFTVSTRLKPSFWDFCNNHGYHLFLKFCNEQLDF